MVDAFHIDLAAIDLVGQSRLQQHLDLHVLDGAALHGQQVVLLIDTAPIHHLPDAGFQHLVKPQAGAAAVALSERVGDIHLHILLDDLVKG